MLKGLLKPDLNARDASERLAAIEKLTDPLEHQSELAVRVQDDSDEKVRLAALAKLGDAQLLADLVMRLIEPGDSLVPQVVRTALQKKFTSVLQAGEPNASAEKLQSVLALESPECNLMLACASTEEAVRTAALAKINDETQIARVVCEAQHHSVRLAAAERLQQPELMQSCVGKIKKRDKVAARQLQHRLDALQREVEKVEIHQASVRQITNGMKSLSESVWSPQYAGQHAALKLRWESLTPKPSAEEQAAYTQHSDSAYEKVGAFKSQQQRLDRCRDSVEALKDSISQLEKADLAGLATAVGAAREVANSAPEDWKSATDGLEGENAYKNDYEKTSKDISSLLATVEPIVRQIGSENKDATAAKGADAINKALADSRFESTMTAAPELRVKLGALSQQMEKDQHRQSQLVEGVGKQLGAFTSTIAAGKWGPAEGMSQRIARKLGQITGKEKQSLQARFDSQLKKLEELADWQDFASKPKLEALVKSMQELPQQSLKPRPLADEIKALQNQWKELGNCRVANQLWPEFKEAGDKAYVPCKEYFEGLKKQREARIQNRTSVCERLEAFGQSEDSDTSDWKGMQRLLVDSEREWRNNQPGGRKQSKSLEARYQAATTRIEELIAPHFEAGETERREIIEKTQKLAENEINQHVINQAKRLQAAWKLCGPASRKEDRKLWKEFNELCGQIFGKHREDQRAQFKASMAHVDRAREIVKTIRALGKKASDQEEKQFSDLQDEFRNLAEFPEKVKKGLLRDFRSACDGYSSKRSSLGKKQEQQELDSLRQLAQICDQLETGVLDFRELQSAAPPGKTEDLSAETKAAESEPADEDDAVTSEAVDEAAPTAESDAEEKTAAVDDVDSWSGQWEELATHVPKPWLKRILKRRSNVCKTLEKGESPFSEKNNDARRLHCIKLEIARDVETPAEDKARRMQFQLEQLQSGPDSALRDVSKEHLREHEVDWLCLPPASPEIAATLEQRFRKALGA